MDGISKTLLHNQEWSLIIKHNIFCLHWILVYQSLSIVFNSDTTLKYLMIQTFAFQLCSEA